ncbi:MAG: 2,3-bisphosphoglycerate-independent phosphoglycerate mutase [Candidatus Aenigmarchaeota archaeon]|nr:2,3-bisphosphoglycerate-independent phosphoglycerate mutase [Candidatus Aenigmarchaeota archaeon]
MKILLVVLDGAGDTGKETPLSLARKPNMDSLAKQGRLGLLDIGYQKDVDSDVGYLNILGCYSKKEYPGRGYLEALGLGLNPDPKDVCIRGNFATLDQRGMLADRRAGREEIGLQELAERLDGTEIDGVKFLVKKSSGHRLVIMLAGESLSEKIIPNDPKRTGVPVPQVAAKSSDAKRTASVLNKFLYRANKLLSSDPINKERKIPANTVLIRNTGKPGKTVLFQKRFGMKGCCIAGIAIAKGVARYLGMDVIEVKGATGMPDTNLEGKAEAAGKSLKKYDFVFLHINGTDILSHDKKPDSKRELLEKIDKLVFSRFTNPKDIMIAVTCDHRTASSPSYKGYEHLPDPVPFFASGGKIKAEGRPYSEQECEKSRLRLEGNGLMEFLVRNSG